MAFSHVQGLGTHGTADVAGNCVITLGANIGAGNTIVGIIDLAPSSLTVNSVKDDKNNTYTVLDTLSDAGDNRTTASFILGNVPAGGPHIITVQFSSGGGNPFIAVVDEYSGALANSNPNDGHAAVQRNAPGAGANAITSSSVTTTVNGDLIWGGSFDFGNANAAQTAGTTPLTFTIRETNLDSVNANAIASEDAVQTTAGSVNVAFTDTTNGAIDNYHVFIVAIKPAAAAAVVEAEPHFIGRTYPLNWTPTKALLRTTAQDFSSFGVETNPHWRGQTWGMPWSPLRALMQNSDPNAPFTQPETNTHFIPRTLPVPWTPMPLARTTAQDFSSFGVETNPHWRGRVFPLQWNLKRDWAPPQDSSSFGVETNPHWIGRPWPVQWNLTLKLRQTDPQDSSSFGVETNPHWQGRPWPMQWQPRLQLAVTDVQLAVQIEAPPHFVFRMMWSLPWNLQASLMRGFPQDFTTLPPASQPVYARYGASHGIGALSAIPGEIPS